MSRSTSDLLVWELYLWKDDCSAPKTERFGERNYFPWNQHILLTGKEDTWAGWQQYLEGLMSICRVLPDLKMKDILGTQPLIAVCYFECFTKELFFHINELSSQSFWEGPRTEESQVWSPTNIFFFSSVISNVTISHSVVIISAKKEYWLQVLWIFFFFDWVYLQPKQPFNSISLEENQIHR